MGNRCGGPGASVSTKARALVVVPRSMPTTYRGATAYLRLSERRNLLFMIWTQLVPRRYLNRVDISPPCPIKSRRRRPMSLESTAVARRWFEEVWNQRRAETIDEL